MVVVFFLAVQTVNGVINFKEQSAEQLTRRIGFAF